MSQTPEPIEDDDTTDRGRRLDPELRIMGAMLRQLEALDAAARARVMAYLNSRVESKP